MIILVPFSALAAGVVGAYLVMGARSEWRRRAALDRYADRELAKEASSAAPEPTVRARGTFAP